MFFRPKIDNISIQPRGSRNTVNKKLCWQAHDDYFECIDKQDGSDVRIVH